MFDATLNYQFTAFVGTAATPPNGDAMMFGEILSAGEEFMGRHLALRAPQIGQMMLVGPNGPENVSTVTWLGKTGVWKLVWAGRRIDVHCDALAYAAIEDTALSVESATQAIVKSLARMVRNPMVTITRTGLVVTAEDTNASTDAMKTGTKLSAPHLEQQAQELTELVVRTNRPADWKLSGAPKPYLINRLETVTANRGPSAPPPTRNLLAWQLDWNTDPEQIHSQSEPMVLDFFTKASSEISRRFEAFQTSTKG